MAPRPLPADHAQRRAAILERKRNVLVDAGAGTGKTTLLADRLVEMIAPTAAGVAPVPLDRIAAITFTRRAAGELKLKIRERILEELGLADERRGGLLRSALAALDTAHVSTIHSFGDRLLRMRPVEAELSPSYEIAEDSGPLLDETYRLLLDSAQSGRLAGELAGTAAEELAEEAQETVVEAINAEVRTETLELEFNSKFGLDALVSSFILQRDVPPTPPEMPGFELRRFRDAAREFIEGVKGLNDNGSRGIRWMRKLRDVLAELLEEDDPARLRSALVKIAKGPGGQKKAGMDDFDDDEAWKLWKGYRGDTGKKPVRDTALRDDLLGPLNRYFALRLVRLFPAVIALYEKVKARRRQLDQIDLLLKLRNLLAGDRDTRAYFQSLFDHVFVDEFQDTDPLQAEIVLFLCEDGARARDWTKVKFASGKLTVVGDPKQSIYRFRRADIAMYERVRTLVASGPHLPVTLSTNFRSAPSLIEFVNHRFNEVLGEPKEPMFDSAEGTVRYQPLTAGRTGMPRPLVHALPLTRADDQKADPMRDTEAAALARYLRWLVESDVRIEDPWDGSLRPVRYGDVAILAISTWGLPRLFPELDRFGIPHAARGGKLFLDDPAHKQFLLGLRALADRDDGVAQAALLRPPFFAVDLADLVHERAARSDRPEGADPERVARATEALELVRELRTRRFERAPGDTARDLLEKTAFGRTVALGANGEQRLERLRELCSVLERVAAEEGLDYDGATEVLRWWVTAPVQLDPPPPVGAEAVQIVTVHQAKGLEFPVVVLWDGMGQWTSPEQAAPFRVERDGRGWTLAIDDLAWEEPPELGLKETEARFRNAERKRVVYVAATRARDLLVIAKPTAGKPGKHINATLLEGAPEGLVREFEPYDFVGGAAWSEAIEAVPEREIEAEAPDAEREQAARLIEIAAEAARPRTVPRGVSGIARTLAPAEGETAADAPPLPPRESRFGNVFGQTVHLAIGICLRDLAVDAAGAVARAARETGLAEHVTEAVGDVERTMETLRRERLAGPHGIAVEFPVAGPGPDGSLLVGYIDLVSMDARRLRVIDFKTDAPPRGPVEQMYSGYAAQVALYAKLLAQSPHMRELEVQLALLFTADGSMHEIPRPAH
jgi:ATP-dependent exoDNAse (exonuclease V) beta subunit